MAAASRIIVLGSLNTDLVIRSSRLPGPGETVAGGEFFQASGGKGANQAVAAARLAAEPVSLLAAAGNDELGRAAIKQLRCDGIDTRHVRMIDGQPTGVALILVDGAGQNLISVASGANSLLTPQDIETIDQSLFDSARVFVASLESPLETVIAGLRRAKSAGLRTILNPAPAMEAAADPELLRHVDVLTPNESEATQLSGWDVCEDLEDVCIWCEQLQQRGPGQVVITRGARGCVVKDQVGDVCLVAAHSVDAVDATAAGDCFTGALAVALAEGRPLLEAVRFASAAAAVSVTRLGAQPSLPTRAEVEAFLATRA